MKPPRGRWETLVPRTGPLGLLIVAPHPDDEVVGPGGLAALGRERGVLAVIVTDGARGAGGRAEEGLAARREAESLAGLTAVGASEAWFLRLSSPELRADPEGAAAACLAWVLERTRPERVVTTAPFEHHATHRATTRATLAALRVHGGAPPGGVWGYPVWDPLVGDEDVWRVDIGAVLGEKLRAIRCHASQCAVRPFDEVARCRHFVDAHLDEVTGSAAAEYQERYVDLGALVDPAGPTLDQWLQGRFARLAAALLD